MCVVINVTLMYNFQIKGKIKIMGLFTGRNMSPLVTADFVGLDVHKAIVDNLYENTNDYAHETFIMPEFALELIKDNKLGRKSGCGLYKVVTSEDASKVINVYDILIGKYRAKKEYDFEFSKQMIKQLKVGSYEDAFKTLLDENSIEASICLELLIKYTIYGIVTSKSIGENIRSSDKVMATGFSWVPPLAVVDAFGGIENFKVIALNKLPESFLSKIDIDETLKDVLKSEYDYRRFFKAR